MGNQQLLETVLTNSVLYDFDGPFHYEWQPSQGIGRQKCIDLQWDSSYIYIYIYIYIYMYMYMYIYVGIDLLEYGVLRSTAADKHVPTKYALRQMQTHI